MSARSGIGLGHRKRFIAAIAGSAAIAIALVGGGWFAAELFVSPAQRAAVAKAPDARPVMVQVKRGDLIDERTMPAQIRAKQEATVTLIGRSGAQRSVVTSVASRPGAVVSVGAVAATINGYPVFVLRSDYPFYRDLDVGDSGPDVEALQQNLQTLGLLTKVDGSFGALTAAAVAALYKRAGFTAPASTQPDSPIEPDDSAKAPTEDAPPVIPHGYLPIWATISLSQVPATVVSAPNVGEQVGEGTSFGFRSDAAEIAATVPQTSSAEVVPGLLVTVTVAGQPNVSGRIGSIEESKVDGQTQEIALIDLDTSEPIAVDLIGRPATVRVNVRVVASNALIVPTIAVGNQADGSGTVQIRDRDGSFLVTPVTIIATLGGRVALATSPTLDESTKVRVG